MWPQYAQRATRSAVLIRGVCRLSETLGLFNGSPPRGGRTVSKTSTAESDAARRLCTLICSSEISAKNFRSAQHLMQTPIGRGLQCSFHPRSPSGGSGLRCFTAGCRQLFGTQLTDEPSQFKDTAFRLPPVR